MEMVFDTAQTLRTNLLEHHKDGAAGLIAEGVEGAVGIEFELTFSATGAAESGLGRICGDEGGFAVVVHRHGEDGEDESRIHPGVLGTNDRQSVYLSADRKSKRLH